MASTNTSETNIHLRPRNSLFPTRYDNLSLGPDAGSALSDEQRTRRRHVEQERGMKGILLFGATMVAAASAVLAAEKMTAPHERPVVGTVQPHEAPWTIANRLEAKYGQDPRHFNVAAEADRIAAEYGTPLQPGQKVEVHVK